MLTNNNFIIVSKYPTVKRVKSSNNDKILLVLCGHISW